MPNAEIVEDSPDRMVYRDKGPWDQFPTITNAVEDFVKAIVGYGHIGNRRLFYIDSDGNQDEILFDADGFKGFKILRDNEANQGNLCPGSDPRTLSLE